MHTSSKQIELKIPDCSGFENLAQVNNSFPLLIHREPPAAGHPSHPGGLPPGWRAAGGLGGLHPTALQHPANDSSRSHRQF